MTRRPRRNHTPAFKAKVAMAAIKGDRTIAQLAEQFDVHANQITTWKDQLQQGAVEVFGPGGGRPHSPAVGAFVREVMRVKWQGKDALAVAQVRRGKGKAGKKE